jgi:ABC-type nickel/cobalt efflux system permease component RcnA
MGSVSAHAPNSSILDIYINKNEQGEILEKQEIQTIFSFNWIQIFNILNINPQPENLNSNTLNQNKDKIFEYIQQNVNIKTGNQDCKLLLQIDKKEPLLGDIIVTGKAKCPKAITDLRINNKLFIDIEPQQLNYINIFKFETLLKAVATTKNDTTFNFNPNDNFNSSKQKDTSNKVLANILETTGSLINSNSSGAILLILLLSIFIGALHALEGGHSKIILASIMINNNVDIKKSLLFVLVFTLTHMSDILLLGVILLFVDNFFSFYERLVDIQLFAIYAMFFLALTMVLKELSQIFKEKFSKHRQQKNKHHHHHDEIENDLTTKKQLLIAFLEGLSPCLTGWTIFMLILSSGKLWLVLPVMGAFGLGIFIVLIILAMLINIFKNKIYEKVRGFSKYSGLLSAALLLATATFFII